MAIILYLLLADPPFQITARIYAGRGVSLKVNEIAGLIAVVGVEEMVVANLQQRCQRRIRGNVSADAGILLVLPVDHRHSIPTDQALDAALHRPISRIGMFFFYGDR